MLIYKNAQIPYDNTVKSTCKSLNLQCCQLMYNWLICYSSPLPLNYVLRCSLSVFLETYSTCKCILHITFKMSIVCLPFPSSKHCACDSDDLHGLAENLSFAGFVSMATQSWKSSVLIAAFSAASRAARCEDPMLLSIKCEQNLNGGKLH